MGGMESAETQLVEYQIAWPWIAIVVLAGLLVAVLFIRACKRR
jgi:hypothetical protein